MIRINPFPILLNNLSNELEDKDLQSLKNVCGEFIPGGQREKNKDRLGCLQHSSPTKRDRQRTRKDCELARYYQRTEEKRFGTHDKEAHTTTLRTTRDDIKLC